MSLALERAHGGHGRARARAAGRGAGGQDAERLLHGVEDGVAGRIVEGLCETGVNNLVFILEEIDRVDDEGAGVLLDVLDPQRRRAFRDAYLDVPFDLCDVLWIATATDPGRISDQSRSDAASTVSMSDFSSGNTVLVVEQPAVEPGHRLEADPTAGGHHLEQVAGQLGEPLRSGPRNGAASA